LEKEYQEKDIFPPKKEIFNAFKFCPFHNLKVVIIGQDPYHGIGQANGLCFSVNDGIAFPPSLKNIFIELTVFKNV
jgi:uracil-DNA glycosylase